MKCPICNKETAGLVDIVRWGPEFAHDACVVAFNAGVEVERARCTEEFDKKLAEAHAARADSISRLRYDALY